jgi:tetratricopeptide (TPR) repeat protein
VAKNSMLAALGILLIGLIGCEIKTPEIRGVVLDAETKQPVEGAWVHATLQIKTKTIAGTVQTVLRVDPPHTRSDKTGEFVIPSKVFEKPAFPTGLGTDIENFTINASTLDDKSDGFYLKDYGWKRKLEVALHVKTWEKGLGDEREYFSYIRSLFNYCLTGRFGVEIPAVEGGCDKWELDFVITKYERYLDRFSNIIQERGYSTALDYLAELYEKKGNYEKAIKAYKESIALMERKGLLKFEAWQKNRDTIERKIKKLQEKLE